MLKNAVYDLLFVITLFIFTLFIIYIKGFTFHNLLTFSLPFIMMLILLIFVLIRIMYLLIVKVLSKDK